MASSLTPNSADWDAVGDAFYRKQEIYRLGWSVADLSAYRIAGAPFAGPIALTFDTSKPVPVLGPHSAVPASARPRIYVYSCSGELIQTVTWDHPSDLIAIGFTSTEALVTVSSNGFYRLYLVSDHAHTGSLDLPLYTQYTLGSVTEELGVLEAIIWPDGMVVMRSDLTFVTMKGWPATHLSDLDGVTSTGPSPPTESVSFSQTDVLSSLGLPESRKFVQSQDLGKIESIESCGLAEKPTAWAVIPPQSSPTGVIQILASREDSIVVIDPMDCTDQRLSAKGPFQRVVPSPNGKFLALLTGPTSPKPYTVWVVSSDFSRELSEFSLDEECDGSECALRGPPTQMVWCGGDTVTVAWERCLVMIGPFGAFLRYLFNDAIHLISEIDGVRIFTSHTCEFLAKVAPSTASVFKPGSTSPAAILFDAMDHFNKHSARVADEHIRNIKKKLPEAVTVCIQAAGREIEPRWQERLMRAAAFGKAFLDVYNPEPFVIMSRTLRILNAIRDYKVGIPLTFEQYTFHPPGHLISRLTARSHYLLALRLTEFLKLSPAPVLLHWSRNLILKMSLPSDQPKPASTSQSVCRQIVSKLKDRHGVSPADIAEIAWSLGKTKLCVELLEYELRPTKQIPLLMKMDRGKEALNQSIKSLDPDLIQSVLWDIRAHKPLAEFLSMAENQVETINTLRVWSKASVERNTENIKDQSPLVSIRIGPDWELFRDLCYQGDRRTESACISLEESYMTVCPMGLYSSLAPSDWQIFFSNKLAKTKSAIQFLSEDSGRVFEQKIVLESVRLLNFQKTLISDVLKGLGGDSNSQATDQMKKGFLDSMTQNKGLTMPSLNETIRQCIKLGLRKQADKLKLDFKVPEKRFWYVKMKALVELKDWQSLDNWAGSKSPIGFEPFVKHLLLMGYHREALRYVPKCEARHRVELYVKCGEWVTAGEECADRGETAKLMELRQRCPNPYVASALSKMIDELAA